jgi:uncharacterized protein YndB with AHSA1/START domain
MAPSIEQEILIDAPVDVVWRAVTEPEQSAAGSATRSTWKPSPATRGH